MAASLRRHLHLRAAFMAKLLAGARCLTFQNAAAAKATLLLTGKLSVGRVHGRSGRRGE